jgi:RNA polymerase sigma factor (sigma-70 family)
MYLIDLNDANPPTSRRLLRDSDLKDMESGEKAERFKDAMLPHLPAAYNLARWLVGNHQDAQDVVQEAYLRALSSFDSFRGGDGRPWLLAIVRNACYTWLHRNRLTSSVEPFDETLHAGDPRFASPEAALLAEARESLVRTALEQLPVEYREVLVLREMEELSYHQISQLAGIPMGTVMSRLARGRQRLAQILTKLLNEGGAR